MKLSIVQKKDFSKEETQKHINENNDVPLV